MTPAACLGIVDWGIGGIGLVRELDRRVPGLPVLYWSDAGATPYGRMRSADLAARLHAVVCELACRGATEAVLACNAASTVAPRLSRAPVPVEGIIGHGLASVPDHVRGPVGVVAWNGWPRVAGRPPSTPLVMLSTTSPYTSDAPHTAVAATTAHSDRMPRPATHRETIAGLSRRDESGHCPSTTHRHSVAPEHAKISDP